MPTKGTFWDSVNIEKYREKYRLYGHTLDVLHLEWSKDGKYLASCGMDHAVIIWDAHNLPSIFFFVLLANLSFGSLNA